MGKKAEFERTRQRQVRKSREQRHRNSAAAKASRQGDDSAQRRVQRTVVNREPISDEKRQMLLDQFSQACRIPAACEDLCVLLRAFTEEPSIAPPKKRTRREKKLSSANDETNSDENKVTAAAAILRDFTSAFLQMEQQAATLEEDETEPVTLLEDVMQDECGSRVLCALMAAVGRQPSDASAALVDVMARVFEESDTLLEHFVACRVLSALVQYGDGAARRRVLRIFQYRAPDAERTAAQLRSRHTGGTIRRLLEHDTGDAAAWLMETLGQNRTLCMELLLDPVAAPAMRGVLQHGPSRGVLLSTVDIDALLQTKRGCKFVQDSLSPELPDWTEATAAAALDTVISACEARLVEMCTDGNGNFVVQAIINLTPHAADTVDRFRRLLHLLKSHLREMAQHPRGVHVVMALATATLSLPMRALAEEVGAAIVSRQNVSEMLASANGSLVVRRLLPLCATADSKVGQMLTSTIEQNSASLLYDATGNIVLQEYIRARGAETLATRLVQSDELLRMCQHVFASHVVGCLLEHVSPVTHTRLCNALKPYAVTLSKHLNGRFVVEKAVHANREMRDVLLHHFDALAAEKGTQHVLCTLVANLDQRGKQHVVNNILAKLVDFATHPCRAIVVQKLMQSEPLVRSAVREELKQKPRLRNEIAQNFYGKFVVQISDTSDS